MKNKGGRYAQVIEGEWTSSNRRDNFEQCCDCGLVHRVEYRIVQRGKRQVIEWRCWRDNKATAGIRTRRRLKISTS